MDHGCPQLPVQAADLQAHLHAQRRVQVGKRLVEQEHTRPPGDGTADGNALALTAGKCLRLALQQILQLQYGCHLADPFVNAPGVGLVQLQAKGDVVVDAHVRIEGIALKDHGYPAIGRRHVVDPSPVDLKFAAVDFLQSGDHA